VEQLIGEVQDEFDLEEPVVHRLDDGHYSVDGAARVDELEEALCLVLPEEGFPTLGGRVFEQLQRRPRVGDEVPLGDYQARVTEVDGMRIVRVLLTRADQAGSDKQTPRDQDPERPAGDQES
jgi:CBS domain containing-hemolysin-like protein